MPFFRRGPASIYYEEHGPGSGFPVLLLAPGSLNSSIEWWRREGTPMNPMADLGDRFRVIAMDQRNAGQSWAPIGPEDNWDTYTADQVGLLDHLGVERAHLMGQCIGGPLIMNFLKTAPQRVVAAVLLQPSGRFGPLPGRRPSFNQWVETLTGHPEMTEAALESMHANMYTADFVYTVTREFVPTCATPLLIMAGNDQAHPFEIARQLAELAPNAEFVPEWKQGAALQAARAKAGEFLDRHTP
ncbi:MAG: alpha/beta fold hydrolase [Dehalococcoidia bacterium]|nr:alpha/beta fold hydrolase [Dehalococcoidia bacterium]